MNIMLKSKYSRYVIIHIMLFLSSTIIGVFIGRVAGNIGEIAFLDKPFYKYFFHNVSSCLVLIIIGVITYGFLTWIPLVYNGIILGMAINFLSYQHSGVSIFYYFIHAIFEIPALMLSIYLGKVLAVETKNLAVSFVKRKKAGGERKFTDLLYILKLLLLMVVFLLVASILESIPK